MNQSDSDLLRRAAATLRTERTGHNAGSGFTRARILSDLRSQRKKRRRWWRVGFPVGIILAGTTAWASANGTLPAIWVTVSTLLNLPLTDNGVSERSISVTGKPKEAERRSPTPILRDQESAHVLAEEQPVEPTATTHAEAALPPSAVDAPPLPAVGHDSNDDPSPKQRRSLNQGAQRETSPRQGPLTETSARSSAPPPPEFEAEVRAFREADDLYRRRGDLEAAVATYKRYARDYPSGRFVPEAKYNTALALIKLSRAAEARPLLAPFAAGVYGSYRQSAAQELLDALGN